MTQDELLELLRLSHVALYGDDSGYVPHDGECPCESCQCERAADAAKEIGND